MEYGDAPEDNNVPPQQHHFSDYSSDEVMEEAFGAVPEAAAEAPIELPNVDDTRLLEFKPDPTDIETHPDPMAVAVDSDTFHVEEMIPKAEEEDSSDPQEYTPNGSGGLTVLLFHKTRGGKGAWLPISTMQLIRVTKGIGKRLRMEVRSAEHISQPSDIELRLFDVMEDCSLAERDFSIETAELAHAPAEVCPPPTVSTVTMELKVFHLCKNLQFHASAVSNGQQLKGTSVQFSTHDSGKQRKKSPTINIDIEQARPPAAASVTLTNSGTITPSSSSSTPRSCSPRPVEPTLVEESQPTTAVVTPQPTQAAPAHHPVRLIVTPVSPASSSSSQDDSARASDSCPEPNPNVDNMDVDASVMPSSSEHEQDTPEESLSSDADSAPRSGKKRKIDHDLSIPVQSGFQHFCPGSLDVHGIVRAQGFVQYSDIRLKTNVEDIMDALQIVTQLQGKRYQWRDGFNMSEELSGGRKVIGLIAQEVKRVLPEVVVEDKGGFLAVNYADLVPLLVEALKQHVQTYETDKKEIKTEINELREKLDSISINTPKVSHPPSPPRAAAPSSQSKGLLLAPGFKRVSEQSVAIESAVIVVLSGWSQWSTPATSNPSSPNKSAAETIARTASDELRRAYPDVSVSTHSLLMGTSIKDTIEDISALVFGKSTLRQDMERSQLVWLIGESHGTVPLAIVCDRLLQLGVLSGTNQHVSLLSVGGVNHHCSSALALSHPNPFVQTGLHDFAASEDFSEYKEALGNLVEHGGVSVVMVGAYEDSLVDLSSALCDQVQHPNILRAVYVTEEFKPLFEPSHIIRMADNVPQEMLQFALELKNSGRELDLVPCLVGSTSGFSLDADTAAAEVFANNHKAFSSLKLHQCLFGTADMPSTVASFYYALGSTFSMFTSWGYSFFKHVQGLRAGLTRHQEMFNSADIFRVSLDWLSRPEEQKMVASTRKMVYRDLYSRPIASPISPRHKFGSMFDPAEQLDPGMAQWVYAVKKLEVQYGTEKTAKLRTSFRYWTPSLPKEQALQRAMQKHLGWGIRASLFGICPGQFLDGFAERVAAEKARELQAKTATAQEPLIGK
eukprot:TRINITY_DN3307_c0_g1_i1.p1 TRINITY_DN3307_c0_g1~~TRINITY_DN3307_c0_g1_i1.p1  ORF type:complete len:1070 (+),score=268.21 TRINITY_DN3307_c0_g1_i1:142-3351(+)